LGGASAAGEVSSIAPCYRLDATIHTILNFPKERKHVLHDG